MLPNPRPFFDQLTDPRRETENKLHALSDILCIALTVIKHHISSVFSILSNTDNVLDVYMGNCKHMPHALQEVRTFLTNHKELKSRFYRLRTDDETALTEADIGGLEIMPATEARKYSVNSVPTYVFHLNGKVFKVAGDTSLEDVYQDIIHNRFDGDKRIGFLDAGVKGPGCPAYIPGFGIAALTEQQKEVINKRFAPPHSANILLPSKHLLLHTTPPGAFTIIAFSL